MISHDWSPFIIAPPGSHGDPMRSLTTPEGKGDRLRAVAFAEMQAREAFFWAARTLDDAPPELTAEWTRLGQAEDKHMNWLLTRMQELGVSITERKVSTLLWESLTERVTAREFTLYMASAEDRGRKAGERFAQALQKDDPETARIFGEIAREEIEHIALAERFYQRPELPNPLAPREVSSNS